MKSSRILQVAQIGCGHFSADQDLPNFQAHPQVRCKWCCDLDKKAAKQLADRFDVPHVTTRIEEVLADPEVDFIKLSTSHEAHLPLIEAACAAGKHVFCEKPLALKNEEALRILGAVRRAGILLCVDFNRRLAPALQRLRAQWLEQRNSPRHQPWRYQETERSFYPDEKRTHFLVRVQDDTASYRMVHLDPLRGGGQILGESVHWLDLACWFFAPALPVEIQAWGSTRFSHGIHLTFDSGDTATILFHCGGTFDYPKELYEVTCNGALFRSEYFVENTTYGIPDAERETFALLRDSCPTVGGEGFAGYLAKDRARIQAAGDARSGYADLMVDKGWYNMLDAWVAAIHGEAPIPCSGLDGYRATYLALQAIESIRLRQALPLPVDRLLFEVL